MIFPPVLSCEDFSHLACDGKPEREHYSTMRGKRQSSSIGKYVASNFDFSQEDIF
jgi:hypothetical protein